MKHRVAAILIILNIFFGVTTTMGMWYMPEYSSQEWLSALRRKDSEYLELILHSGFDPNAELDFTCQLCWDYFWVSSKRNVEGQEIGERKNMFALLYLVGHVDRLTNKLRFLLSCPELDVNKKHPSYGTAFDFFLKNCDCSEIYYDKTFQVVLEFLKHGASLSSKTLDLVKNNGAKSEELSSFLSYCLAVDDHLKICKYKQSLVNYLTKKHPLHKIFRSRYRLLQKENQQQCNCLYLEKSIRNDE